MPDILHPSKVSAVMTTFSCHPDAVRSDIVSHIIALQAAGAKSSGFWSGEILAPNKNQPTTWQLVQRFDTIDHAQLWFDSDVRSTIVKSIVVADTSSMYTLEHQVSDDIESEVSTAIVTQVRPGMEQDFFNWIAKIQYVQAIWPGFRSVYLEPPAATRPELWATVLRFDSPESLESWLVSKERKTLLDEVSAFVKVTKISKLPSSFPGWFPHDEVTGASPAKWKTAVLVLLGLFPVVLLETDFLFPYLAELPTPVKMFIGQVGSVGITTFISMPLLVKSFKWWLLPAAEIKSKIEIRGAALIISLFALEIGSFCLFMK